VFAIESLRHSAVIVCVLAATLLGPGITRAQDTATAPSPLVAVHWALAPGSHFPSFDINLQVGDTDLQGSIQPLVGGARLAGTYSRTRLEDDVLSTRFGMEVILPTKTSSQSLGLLEMETRVATCCDPVFVIIGPNPGTSGGGVADPVFVIIGSPSGTPGGDGGDIIVFDIVDSVALSTATTGADIIALSVTPATATEQLRCEPARTYQCNIPAPGATLQVSFPNSLSEETSVVTLYSNERPESAAIRVFYSANTNYLTSSANYAK
jgi:hypothetical protein